MKKIFFVLLIIAVNSYAQVKILKAEYTLLTIDPYLTLEAKATTEIDLKKGDYMFSLSQNKEPFDDNTVFTGNTTSKDTIMYKKIPGLCYDTMEYFFDTKKDSVFSLLYVFNCKSKVLIKEKIIKPEWVIEDSLKVIGGYNAQKATTQLYGRKWIAYFTTEIEKTISPWRLNGLPGTILEAYDESEKYFFSLDKIELIEKDIPLKKPYCEKEMSFEKYKEFAIKTFEDDMLFQISQIPDAVEGSVTRDIIPPYQTLDILQEKEYSIPE